MGITDNVYKTLKARLIAGEYHVHSKFPSGEKLALEFHINKMTANKVVSMLIGEGFLFRPGSSGAGTIVNETVRKETDRGMLAFLGPLSPYAVLVLRGVMHEVNAHDFLLTVEAPAIEDFQRRMEFLKNRGVTGIINIGYGIQELPSGMSQVCIDVPNPPKEFPSSVHFINSDNYNGGFNIMSEIIRRGHRGILIFSSQRYVRSKNFPVSPRVSGMQSAMKKNGIPDAEERSFYAMPQSMADTKSFLRSYLKKYPDTTVIATDSDDSADLIFEAAKSLKISCPGDIALTGFGHISSLPIATVDQNAEYQGALAARRLIELCTGHRGFPKEESPMELVETKICNSNCIPIRLNR